MNGIIFYKQKTAYDMRISDWSSDVCSSDLECKRTAPTKIGTQSHQWRNDAGAVDHNLLDGSFLRIPALAIPSLPARRCRALCQLALLIKIGRASCRERECQYV